MAYSLLSVRFFTSKTLPKVPSERNYVT